MGMALLLVSEEASTSVAPKIFSCNGTRVTVEGRQRYRPGVTDERAPSPPLLRGWFHTVAFGLSLPAGLVLVLAADGARARIATSIYAVGVAALFGVSAAYHRGRWSAKAQARM